MLLVTKMIGKVLIAIALIVVPFSMSQTSMSAAIFQSESVNLMSDHQHEHRYADHQMEEHSTGHSSHEGHDNANCCPSICSGAIFIHLDLTLCLAFSKQNMAFGSKFLEQGEWVPPFRPPSI